MENYYLLRRDSDPDVIGVKNGVKQADIRRDGYANPEKFDVLKENLGTPKYWEIRDSIMDADFEIQCARLLPKARRTDFVQFGPVLMNCPFLISKEVADVILQYNLQRYRMFPVVLDSSEGLFEYKLLYLSPDHDEIIDCDSSVFCTGNDLIGREFHRFRTAEERLDFSRRNFGLKLQEFHLSKDCNELDLFSLDGAEVAISEKLKSELVDRDLVSGVKILPAFGQVPWPIVVK